MNRKSRTAAFESLEDRRLFAVAMALVGPGVLGFQGDAANDTIYLYDNGNGVISGSRSVGGGVMAPFGPIAGISRCSISTMGGDDRVYHTVYGDVLAGSHTVSGSLGDGNDYFSSYAGNDIDIFAGARLDVRVTGDLGNDTMKVLQSGEVDGTMTVALLGMAGDDTMVADVRCDAGSSGQVYAELSGFDGNDRIDLLVRKNFFDPVSIGGYASGGNGFDVVNRTVWCSNDVTCEIVAVVP